jgi:thioredoxin 2
MNIACPSCGGMNRIPEGKSPAGGHCGKCHDSLFTGQPLKIDAAGFERHLSEDIPLVVDFWAPWCGPCRAMEPAFESAAADLEPRARLAKINTDDEQSLAGRYSIRGIPTCIIFKGGQEADRRSGAMDRDSLVSWISSHL